MRKANTNLQAKGSTVFQIPRLNINKAEESTSFTTYFNIIPTNCKPKQQTDSVNVHLLQNFNTLAKQVSFLSKRNVIRVGLKLSFSTKKKALKMTNGITDIQTAQLHD